MYVHATAPGFATFSVVLFSCMNPAGHFHSLMRLGKLDQNKDKNVQLPTPLATPLSYFCVSVDANETI